MTHFEKAIKTYLDRMAESDASFAEKYGNKKKSIEDCCRFIISEMQKRAKGSQYGATDDEVYGLAVHYYDEEDIKAPGSAPSCKVVVNQAVEVSPEDEARIRENARKEAEERIRQDELKKLSREQEKARKRAENAQKRAAAKKAAEEEAKRKRQEEWDKADLLFSFDDEEE